MIHLETTSNSMNELIKIELNSLMKLIFNSVIAM